MMEQTPAVGTNADKQKGPAIQSNRPVIWLLLFLLLGLGGYLRLAGLYAGTGFEGDQGEYYQRVMDWVIDGHWPLVGQRRSIGDYTIGPGFIYTLTPALALTHFHPCAGAVMTILFSLAAVLLAFFWLARSGGNPWLALLFCAVWSFAPELIRQDRSVWNPHLLPFATLALTLLIARFGERPLRCLMLALMLMMIMPQWHTTALIPLAVSVPFFLVLILRHKAALRATPRRASIAWGIVLAIWFVVLYLPPVIYEIRSPKGNLIPYLTGTFFSAAAKPSEYPLFLRFSHITNLYSAYLGKQIFAWPLKDIDVGRWLLTLWFGAAVLTGLVLERRRLAAEPSPLFLALLTFVFWLVAVKQSEYFDAYYWIGMVPAPLLLTGWAAARLLARAGNEAGAGRSPWRARAASVAIMLPVAAAGLRMLPEAWQIHRQATGRLAQTEQIVAHILRASEGRPFSLALIQPYTSRNHFDAFLWKAGRKPLNRDMESTIIRPDEFGELAFVIIRDKALDFFPVWQGAAPLPTQRVGDSDLICVPRRLLPPGAKGLETICDPPTRTNVIAIR